MQLKIFLKRSFEINFQSLYESKKCELEGLAKIVE